MKKNHTKITKQSNKNSLLHLLVFRLSSMGDVALTLPVIRGLLENNPDLHITLVSRHDYAPLFYNLPRFKFYPCDFNDQHKGFTGLIRLYDQLKKTAHYDYVVDLHDVLRTWILTSLFMSAGYKILKIKKGRAEKIRLTRGKIFHRLKSTPERYLEPFESIDLKFKFPDVPVINIDPESTGKANEFLNDVDSRGSSLKIGLAPFAKHKLKIWPLEYIIELIQMIEKTGNSTIFLFGGGREEIRKLEFLGKDFQSCISVAGKLSLGAELALMQHLDAMITMDSANMHLSSLAGIPAITIWGGTHPYAGFEAYGQQAERNIQISKDELICRPCTVFGKGECKRGDFACMRWLSPDLVFKKLRDLKIIPDPEFNN